MKTLRNKCKLHITEQQQEQGRGDKNVTFITKNIHKDHHHNPDYLYGCSGFQLLKKTGQLIIDS